MGVGGVSGGRWGWEHGLVKPKYKRKERLIILIFVYCTDYG